MGDAGATAGGAASASDAAAGASTGGAPSASDAASAAAAAGVAAGAIDPLQAAALVALAEAVDDLGAIRAVRRTLAGELSQVTLALRLAAEDVLHGLEDPDAETRAPKLEVSDLAELVARLGDEVAAVARRLYDPQRAESANALYAPPAWTAEVTRAIHHLKEARDLIDDGMTSDAAAFEVMAAREALKRALIG